VLQVLSDEDARANYNAQLEVALQDEEDDYTGEPLSKWIPSSNPSMAKNEDPAENRAVFVVSLPEPTACSRPCCVSC
jgi:hypothetical protein